MAQQKFLDLTGLTSYDKKSKTTMDTKDAATLASAKAYADGLGSNYDPAGTAQTKVTELANGQVATNKNDIATLKSGKADKGSSLVDYGIEDAYTKGQTDSAIQSAVANAGHLKREIVETKPEVSAAKEHVIYMVPKKSASGENKYDEYMLIISGENKSLEKIGDSAVDLTNYATKTEVATAKTEAINTASTDATTKSNNALVSAKSYADGLAENYATAAQGAKADTALQKASITSGATNGSIAVGGTDVAVKGLGSAAYVATTAFDAAGVAEAKVNALSTGQVTTNKNNIATLRTDVDNLKSTTYVAISTEEIDALFA